MRRIQSGSSFGYVMIGATYPAYTSPIDLFHIKILLFQIVSYIVVPYTVKTAFVHQRDIITLKKASL